MPAMYSKHLIEKEINGTVYQAKKLAAYELSREGFNILLAVSPATVQGIDAMMGLDGTDNIFPTDNIVEILYLLQEKLTDEMFMRIQDKMMGSLMIDRHPIPDWSNYFDDHLDDYWDVLVWLAQENFYDFFTRQPFMKKFIERVKGQAERMKTEEMPINNSTSPNTEN